MCEARVRNQFKTCLRQNEGKGKEKFASVQKWTLNFYVLFKFCFPVTHLAFVLVQIEVHSMLDVQNQECSAC